MSFQVSAQYREMIQKMFEQVKSTISHLLDYLTSMYSAHGINYDAKPFYSNIVRMLSPFQLLTFLKLDNPNELLYSQHISTKVNENFIRNYPTVSVKLGQKPKNNPVVQNPKQQSQANQEKKQKSAFNQKFLELKKNKLRQRQAIDKKSLYRISNGGKPLLSQSQEARVSQFMTQEYKKGKVLTLKAMADYAKRIAKNNPHFLGSQGWAKGFLIRHPDMKALYKKSKQRSNSINFTNIQYQIFNEPESERVKQKEQQEQAFIYSYDNDNESLNLEPFQKDEESQEQQQWENENQSQSFSASESKLSIGE